MQSPTDPGRDPDFREEEDPFRGILLGCAAVLVSAAAVVAFCWWLVT